MGVSREDATADAMGKLKTEVQRQSELIAYTAANATTVATAEPKVRALGGVTDVTRSGRSITVATFADSVAGSSDMWSAGVIYLRTCYALTVEINTDKPSTPRPSGIPCPDDVRSAAGGGATFVDLPATW